MVPEPARRPCQRVGLALAVVALFAGCTEQPRDIEVVAPMNATEDSASTSTVSTVRPARVSTRLADTEFGRRIAVAVRSSPALLSASAAMREAEAGVQAESGAFMPEVSLGAEATSALNGSSRTTPLVEVTQLIYDGGASRSRTAAAQARVVQSRSDRISELSTAAYEAVRAHQDLYSARQRLRLAERNRGAHARILSQIEERVTAGAGASADLETARSRLASARSREVEARVQRDRAISAYRQVFNTMPPATISGTPKAPPLPGDGDLQITHNSPRLRSLSASLKAAEGDLAAARAARRPMVSFGVTGQRDLEKSGVDVGVNLGLDYDLGLQGRQKAAIRRAEARMQQLEAEREALRRDIVRSLADVRADQRAGSARIAAARDAVNANEAAVAAALDRFSIGRQNLLGLLDAQRDLYNAGEALITAERELALTGYAALSLTGDILDAFDIVADLDRGI
ncbi:MAG: hypothetical protein FH759_10455 [Sediminimonas qiaohouensis]|uniref:TolC family protein n=1 Tax=Sediminimonas qiaohouensis TaxID=552061 RepID=A0A7C9LBF3_9RHOB|nr:hypothetical protein [Sediminimonas qiaohouensis]